MRTKAPAIMRSRIVESLFLQEDLFAPPDMSRVSRLSGCYHSTLGVARERRWMGCDPFVLGRARAVGPKDKGEFCEL